jgi:adenosylcobinamide-GDP ribazoletransferase
MEKFHDFLACLRFFSRLPIPVLKGEVDPHGAAIFVRALALAPFAGAVLGLCGGVVLVFARALGAPPNVAALLALACAALLTGAMHEDGLADVADGFGGGSSRERKLEIMRDSRIGAYGATALILGFGLRAAALAALAVAPGRALLVMIAAGAVSRAACLAPLVLLPPARADGAGGAASALTQAQARPAFLAALAFAALPGFAGAGLFACAGALALAAAGVYGLCLLARAQIGGQTGDVAGAAQQVAEIALLCVFSGVFG